MGVNKPLLIVFAGPTAVGKTAVAGEIAGWLNTSVISADSRQIYKEMSIGTAVPSKNERNNVPYYFVQSHSVLDYYNASMFEQEVLELLHRLYQQHDKVVLAGGSGLYVQAVCSGIDDIPTVRPDVRKMMAARLEREGLDTLTRELKKCDPLYYEQADLNNPKRVLKALEVYYQTGLPYTSFLTGKEKQRPFRLLKIGLNMERDKLYQRINDRVSQMVDNGLVEEAREVYHIYQQNPVVGLNTVGYKELFAYFDDRDSLDEAIEKIQNNTRKYARKQLNWFARDSDIQWFHPEDVESIKDLIRNYCFDKY